MLLLKYSILKCKECWGDIKLIRRSHIIPSQIWYECKCNDGNTLYVPAYIPDEQIERYLSVTMQKL